MSLHYDNLHDLPPHIRAQVEKQLTKRVCQKQKKGTLPALTESQEQQAVMAWAAVNTGRWPELRLFHHIPNGGGRSKAQAGILKAEGVKAGVPDLHLPVARGGYHSLYVEMKSQTGTTSEAQKEWIAALLDEGNLAVVCRGCAAAVEVIEEYLGEESER